MHYLLLYVAFMVTFSQGLRYAQRRGAGVVPVSAANYVAAATLCAAVLLVCWSGQPADGRRAAWMLGATNGATYVGSLIFMLAGYRLVGIGITLAFTQIGVTVPVLVSFLFWGEAMSPFQWAALALLPAAVVLMRPPTAGRGKLTLAGDAVLVGAMLTAGTAGTIHKAFRVWGPKAAGLGPFADGSLIYLAALFAVAAVLTVAYVRFRRLRYGGRIVAMGASLGVVNILASLFILLALAALPAAEVFPVSSSAVIGLSVLLGRILWKERVSARQAIGVVVAIAVVVLANVKAG